MTLSMSDLKQRRKNGERGAALLEFAIAIPIFIGLLLLIFDAGLGYSASRTSSSAARSAARVGALSGELRDADFRALDALRAAYGASGSEGQDSAVLGTIIVYKSDPDNPNGAPPAGCLAASVPEMCNTYDASILNSLTPETFAGVAEVDGVTTCDPDSPDAAWCPLNRRNDNSEFLGVYITSVYDTTTGIESDAFDLEDRAVFALYFAPEPIEIAEGGE